MQLYKAKVIQPCKGAKRGKNGSVSYKSYAFNQTISGTIANGSITPDSHVDVFQTPDGFMIPMHCINIQAKLNRKPIAMQDEIQDAVIVEDKAYIPKGQFKAAGKMLNASGSLFDTTKRTKAAMNGGMIGAAAGLFYAFSKGKNKWLFVTIGAVIGYVGGTAYHNFVKDDSKAKI